MEPAHGRNWLPPRQQEVPVKYVVPAITVLLVVPRATQAQIDLSQIDIRLPSLEDPALRANIGPWSVAATLGARGVDLRVEDRMMVERARRTSRESRDGAVGYDRLSSSRGAWFVDHHVATRRVLSNGINLVGNLTAALRTFTRLDLDPPDRAP